MFVLDPQLQADTFELGKLAISRILLMNNREFPWVILVPERQDKKELTDLNLSERMVLMSEISMVSNLLQQEVPCDKINIGMLGNKVSQLHVHIIARTQTDLAWPNPVWGVEAQGYSPGEKNTITKKLTAALQSFDEFLPLAA